MTETELAQAVAQLRAEGTDDAIYEAKECARALSHDIWESVSAFANTHGGVLLLGLSERSGFTPVPDFKIDKVCRQFCAGMGEAGEAEAKLANPPRYQLQRLNFEGSPLVVVTVEELPQSQKPCYKKEDGRQKGGYKRVGDADIQLTPEEVEALACSV